MATFNLQIVTPDKLFYNEDVDMLVVRTTEGDVGILKGHIDYVASLDIGIIKIKKDYNISKLFGDNPHELLTDDETKIYEINREAFKNKESYKKIYKRYQ